MWYVLPLVIILMWYKMHIYFTVYVQVITIEGLPNTGDNLSINQNLLILQCKNLKLDKNLK